MKKLSLCLRKSSFLLFLILSSCTLLPWDKGELAVTQLKSNIPGNVALEKLRKDPEVEDVVKFYGYPKTLKLVSEDNSLTLYYPKNNQYITLYEDGNGWTRNLADFESSNEYLEIYKLPIQKKCSFAELTKIFTGEKKNEKRLRLVNKKLQCKPGEYLILPKYLATNIMIENLTDSEFVDS